MAGLARSPSVLTEHISSIQTDSHGIGCEKKVDAERSQALLQ